MGFVGGKVFFFVLFSGQKGVDRIFIVVSGIFNPLLLGHW